MAALWLSLGGCLASEPTGREDEELGRPGGPTPTLCSPERFRAEPGVTILQCCQDGPRTFHASVTPNGTRRLWLRTHHEFACREADGIGTNCGIGSSPFQQCAYGPCRASVAWRVDAAQTYVFEPDADGGKCGWYAEGIQRCLTDDPAGCAGWIGQTRYQPEPYTDQPLHPPVIGTCPYVDCRVGGIPIAPE